MNTGGIRIQVHITDTATDQLQDAQRKIRAATRRGIKAAGEKAILPYARHELTEHTPVAAGQLVVRTTASDGRLTVLRRKDSRIVGLLNYGGKQKGVEPRRKKAIAFRAKDGTLVIVRRTKVRQHKGTHFLEEAVDDRFPQYREVLLDEVMQSYEGLDHTP